MGSQRERFLEVALSQIGKPYKWAGNGPKSFDCSGLCVYAGIESGLFNKGFDTNANGLCKLCKSVTVPEDGDLVFYSRSKEDLNINHVMIVLKRGFILGCFGASGGDQRTTSIDAAMKQDAYVKFFSTVKYRKELICFGRLPFNE